MSKLIGINKPYGVVSQFRSTEHGQTLSEYIALPDVYPAGRLDKDSEGLLLLTDDGKLQSAISHPRFKMPKTYWIQVEGIPDENALRLLRQGIQLKDGLTRPASAEIIAEPDVWRRTPPVRFRASIPTCWLSLTIKEGRNRQVRRMTAAAGYPTLRLIRYAIGPWSVENLAPGEWRSLNIPDKLLELKNEHSTTKRTRHRRRVNRKK